MSEAPTVIKGYQMVAPEAPLELKEYPVPELGPGDVLIEVAGCGLCHTDLGFLYGGVQTRKPPPLTLGHEISGTVVTAGEDVQQRMGQKVVIPSVIPCGECDLCRAGRGNVCRSQLMPGNDFNGGFASHIAVPGRFLSVVDDIGGMELSELSVIADAVTTPYMAMRRAKVVENDLVICIGVGGVGGYGVQIASAFGAMVIAIDVDADKLEKMKGHGARWTIDARDKEARDVQKEVRALVKSEGLPRYGWKVFEMSGTAAGQSTAFSLLSFAGTLAVVGFTMEKVKVRLSNLMAFDADAFGTWGCVPELYDECVKMVLDDDISLRPFSSRHPLSEINGIIDRTRSHELTTRAILEPDV